MKRITTTIIICLCMLLLWAGREWIAAGTEDMPIAVFRSWINSAGELSTVEYAACDNDENRRNDEPRFLFHLSSSIVIPFAFPKRQRHH